MSFEFTDPAQFCRDNGYDEIADAADVDAPARLAMFDQADAARAEIRAAGTKLAVGVEVGEIPEVDQRARQIVRQHVECRRNATVRHLGPRGYQHPLKLDPAKLDGYAGVLFAAKPSDVHELGHVDKRRRRYTLDDIIATRGVDWGTAQGRDGKQYPCDWRGHHCGITGGAPIRSYLAVACAPFLVLFGVCSGCESEIGFDRAGRVVSQRRNDADRA